MTNSKIIQQGAEAIISLKGTLPEIKSIKPISDYTNINNKNTLNKRARGACEKSINPAERSEAAIFQSKAIIKNRIKKSYRISEIDSPLRKSRTKSEAKIISKLSTIIPVPKIINTDNKEIIEMQFIDGKKLSDNLESLDYKSICKQIAENITRMHDENIIHGDLTTSNMIFVEDDDNLINKTVLLNPNFHELKNLTIKNKLINTKIINKPHILLNQQLPDLNKLTMKSLSKRRLLNKDIQSSESKIENSLNKVYFIDFGLSFHSQKIEDKAVDLHLLQQALEAKHFTIWRDCWNIILENYNAEKSKEIIHRIKVIESRGRYKDKY